MTVMNFDCWPKTHSLSTHYLSTLMTAVRFYVHDVVSESTSYTSSISIIHWSNLTNNWVFKFSSLQTWIEMWNCSGSFYNGNYCFSVHMCEFTPVFCHPQHSLGWNLAVLRFTSSRFLSSPAPTSSLRCHVPRKLSLEVNQGQALLLSKCVPENIKWGHTSGSRVALLCHHISDWGSPPSFLLSGPRRD